MTAADTPVIVGVFLLGVAVGMAFLGLCLAWDRKPKPKGVDELLAEHAAEMDQPDLDGNAAFYDGLPHGDRL